MRDEEAGELKLSRPGMINRRHYYGLAGMASPRSGNYAEGLFEGFEERLPTGAATQWEKAQEATRSRLKETVLADFHAGCLVRDNWGKVSRVHYTASIGVNHLMASRYLSDTFLELDGIAGRVRSYKPRTRTAQRASGKSARSTKTSRLETLPRSDASSHVHSTPGISDSAATASISNRAIRAIETAPLASAEMSDGDMTPQSTVSSRTHPATPSQPKVKIARSPRPEESHAVTTPIEASGLLHGRAAPRRDEVRKALTQLLEIDFETDKVVMSRGGKISRKHYTQKLGVAETSASGTLLDIFSDFETRLGSPERLHDLRMPEMRQYIEGEWESGRLGVRDGRVDRTIFMKHFGFKGGTVLTRYPNVRALFEEFDERVQREGYWPSDTRAQLASLDAILKHDPPLAKNGRDIDRASVARLMEVDCRKLTRAPFAERLAEADRDNIARIDSDDRVVVSHGRNFDFSELSEFWPDALVVKIARCFKEVSSSRPKNWAKTTKEATIELFRHVGLRRAAASASALTQDEWELGVRNLGQTIRGTLSLMETTRDQKIGEVNRACDLYARKGVVPALSARLRGIKNADRLGGRLPSLAEAVSSTKRSDRAEAYIEFASRTVREAASRQAIELDPEADSFAEAIAQEAHRDPTLATLSIPQACLRIIDRRLEALRRAALGILDGARAIYEQGKIHLSQAVFDAASFTRDYLAVPVKNLRNTVVRSAFPLDMTDDPTKSIRNMLAFAEQSYGGAMPSAGSALVPVGFGQFFPKRYLELGGRPFLDAHLNPSSEAVCSSILLYLIESGANLPVGRTLWIDAIEASELKGHVQVTGRKATAAGKPIIVYLEADSDAARGMRWILDATERRRRRCAEGDRNILFLVDAADGSCQPVTEFTFRGWFKKLASEEEELKGLHLNPSMIRTAVLLKAAIENDGRIQAGAILGQHGVEVSKLYQQRAPILLMYDEKVRVFQRWFEVAAADVLAAPHLALGISEAEWEHRLATVLRTGLGVFCKGVDGKRRQNGICKSLDCWNDCPSMLFVAKVDAIVDLQIWQASLRRSEGDWIRDRAERWVEVWLPWLCFCDVVEEKLARGPGLSVWQAATARRAEIEAGPSFSPPRPW